MQSAQEIMTKIIQAQPEDASYEEIIRELVFAQMVEKGLDDSRKGIIIGNVDMALRIGTWLR
jgi:hypothetical protein